MSLEEWTEWLEGEGREKAKNLWYSVSRIVPAIPPPQAGPLDDEEGFQFVWNVNEHHLEIDTSESVEFEWFYYNRKTRSSYTTDDITAIKPYLRLICG